MKKVQLSFCLFLIISALQAQVTIGPKVGLNVDYESFQFSGNYAGNKVTSRTAKVGYQAGLAINIKTSDYFSIRPEVLFNEIGGNTTFGDNNNSKVTNNTYDYVSIPLNFVGTFPCGPGKINIFVAPQYSIGIGGKYSQTTDSSGLFVTKQNSQSGSLQTTQVPSGNSSTGYFNQMNWGINYGIGYQIGGLLFTGQYHMGITNTQPHYVDSGQESHRNDIVSKNYGVTIGLTYFFGNTKDE
jgi:hypothetical protein